MAARAFAVHPLRSEPIGWVSARGTILAGLLVLLSVWAHVEGWRRSRPGRLSGPWLGGAVALGTSLS